LTRSDRGRLQNTVQLFESHREFTVQHKILLSAATVPKCNYAGPFLGEALCFIYADSIIKCTLKYGKG